MARTKLPINGRKPEKSILLRQNTTNETIIIPKGTRMVKDGEDLHGLQNDELEKCRISFQDAQNVTKKLRVRH